MAAENLVQGAGAVVADADDFLIYDTDTGLLYYDADGNLGGARVEFVNFGVVDPLTLAASDFVVV
ncbi:hypothetical protein D3C83_318930 [compost metagenome]